MMRPQTVKSCSRVRSSIAMQQTVLYATMCLPYSAKDVKTAQKKLVMTAFGHDDAMSLQCLGKPASSCFNTNMQSTISCNDCNFSRGDDEDRGVHLHAHSEVKQALVEGAELVIALLQQGVQLLALLLHLPVLCLHLSPVLQQHSFIMPCLQQYCNVACISGGRCIMQCLQDSSVESSVCLVECTAGPIVTRRQSISYLCVS